MISIRTDEEVELLREACRIAATALRTGEKAIRDGVTTGYIDKLIEDEILKMGAKPAFKGYRGYRHTACISINEEIVHGIPGNKEIKDGDIVGLDVGSIFKGYYGDVARTVLVGDVKKSARKLAKTTEECLEIGIRQVRKGNHVGDIAAAIEEHATRNGYSVVKDLFGHGVGKELHEEPLIPNFGKKGSGPRLEKGYVFAIEPMLNMGTSAIETLADGWTVVTRDRKLSAHFEHTVHVTDGEPDVLTRI